MTRSSKLVLATAAAATGLAVIAVMAWFARSSPSQAGRAPEAGGAPALVRTTLVGPNRWLVSRSERDRYLSDPGSVMKDITLKPAEGTAKDSITHLAIVTLVETSPMYAAGFRRDDRILKVNGTPIGTVSRAMNLVHEIEAGSRLTVQVQRGDQIVDYEFDFK